MTRGQSATPRATAAEPPRRALRSLGDAHAARTPTTVAAHGRDGGRLFYASHNFHPFFLQGTKTLAYELWEDLGFRAPDNVIIPTGAGSNILGCDLGFGELISAGEIASRPRLFCAQPLLCSPIATAVLEALGADDGQTPPKEWNTPAKTMAEGTSINRPVRLAATAAFRIDSATRPR